MRPSPARGVAFAVAGLLLAALTVPAAAQTGDRLYYTTFDPPRVKSVPFTLSGSSLQVGDAEVIAEPPGADGIVFAPDGSLMVGGAASGRIFRIDPDTGQMESVEAGGGVAYHVSVDPNGRRLWTGGLPGSLSEVPLPLAPGVERPLRGDDTEITSIGFAGNSAFYTSSTYEGFGNFGRIDLGTLTTSRLLRGLRGAHGITFDPYTGNLFLVGGFAIVQIDPANPGTIRSQRLVPEMRFDQGSADGKGRLFVASNTGHLVVVDFSSTRLVGDANNVVVKAFLDENLDDLAPLTGLGAPADDGESSNAGLLVAGAGAVVLAVGLVVFFRRRRRRW